MFALFLEKFNQNVTAKHCHGCLNFFSVILGRRRGTGFLKDAADGRWYFPVLILIAYALLSLIHRVWMMEACLHQERIYLSYSIVGAFAI